MSADVSSADVSSTDVSSADVSGMDGESPPDASQNDGPLDGIVVAETGARRGDDADGLDDVSRDGSDASANDAPDSNWTPLHLSGLAFGSTPQWG